MTFTVRGWGCVAAALMACATGLLAGCEQHTAEKGEIKRVFAASQDLKEQRDGEGLAEVYTAGSFERYDELIKLALDGDEKSVRALGPMDKIDVLRMRCRATRKELKGQDGRAFVEWACSGGWFA